MKSLSLKQDIVTETVRDWIMSGKFRPGQKLPTDVELSSFFQVNKCTIAAGLNRLVDENILDRAPRRGSIVKKQDQVAVTNGVALILPQVGEVYSDLAQSIGIYLGKNGLYPILVDHTFANDHDEIISFLNRMTSRSLPHGYMCVGGGFFPYEVFRKNPLRYKNIVFLLSFCGTEEIPGCRYVLIDYAELGAQIVRYFAERNIRRILFPAHYEMSFSSAARSMQVTLMESIRYYAEKEGISFDEGLFWRTHYGVSFDSILPDAIRREEGIAGIFSYSDSKLANDIIPVLDKNHFKDGRDVLLLGNFNTRWAKQFGFDSFDMRVQEIAKYGTEMLTGTNNDEKIMLAAKLVINRKTKV